MEINLVLQTSLLKATLKIDNIINYVELLSSIKLYKGYWISTSRNYFIPDKASNDLFWLYREHNALLLKIKDNIQMHIKAKLSGAC